MKKVNNNFAFSVIGLRRPITAREEEEFLNEQYRDGYRLFDKEESQYVFISRDNE